MMIYIYLANNFAYFKGLIFIEQPIYSVRIHALYRRRDEALTQEEGQLIQKFALIRQKVRLQ